MIVEFFGLPATGKTSIALKLSDGREWKIVKVYSRFELLWLNAIFVVKYPRQWLKLLAFVIKYSLNYKLFYYKFINAFLYSNSKFIKAKKMNCAIIDQGHFQGVISLFEKKITKDETVLYMATCPLPDILVVFKSEENERRLREAARENNYRDQFGPEYKNAWREIIAENTKTFLEIIAMSKIPHFLFNSDETVDRLINQLRRYE